VTSSGLAGWRGSDRVAPRHNVLVVDEPTDPIETTTRRGWLSALARTARQRVQEGAEALGPEGLPGLLAQIDPFSDVGADSSGGPDSAAGATSRRPARAPDRAISVDELITMAHEEGLTRRDDALRSLARVSLRMTSVVPRCAEAWILTDDTWADVSGADVLLAQINLAVTAVSGSGLPTEGWLVLFAGTEAEPSGGEGLTAHGVLLESPAAPAGTLEPVALGPELMLPRVWSDTVQALDLDDEEADAYDRLRMHVQERQGVELEDDGGWETAYHRLFGYPDDTTGTMPSECAGTTSEPAEWRLLAQISLGEFRRAYLWIRDADLRRGSFENLRAFVR
jgi:hypothetical protein